MLKHLNSTLIQEQDNFSNPEIRDIRDKLAEEHQDVHGDYIASSDPERYDDMDSDGDHAQRRRFTQYSFDTRETNFFLGQTFRNVHDFREALQNYSITRRYALRYKKNEPRRVRAVCKNEKCR